MSPINWFDGNLEKAIKRAVELQALLIFYIEGTDQLSEKITSWLENPRIVTRLNNNKLVCVRIAADSPSYVQFAQIYNLVPVPSIFFLSNKGMPIDVITSMIPSMDELENKIISIQTEYEKENSSIHGTAIKNETSVKTTTTTTTTNTNTANTMNIPLAESEYSNASNVANEPDSKVNDTNGAMENQQSTRLMAGADDLSKKVSSSFEANETVLVNDINEMGTSKAISEIPAEQKTSDLPIKGSLNGSAKETEDRKKGPMPIDDERQIQNEYNKKVLSEIRREQLEAKVARDQVKAQIAADKLERAKKFAQIEKEFHENVNKKDQQQSTSRKQNSIANQVILQFRFGEGETLTQSFEFNTQLSVIRQFVRDTIMKNSMDFKLATTYPMREFTIDEDNMTLEELRLTPTAVIMVISKNRMTVGNIIAKPNAIFNVLHNLFWAVLNPIINGIVSIKDWLTGRGATGQLPRTFNIQSNKGHLLNGNRDNTSKATARTTKNTNSSNPENSAYLRYATGSNVHRLSDQRPDSDNDDNATWNGNSTQQQ